jgi:hypothetical protein
MPAGSIVVDLLLRSGSFQTDTERAEKRLKKFEAEVAARTRGMVTSFAKVTGAIAGIAGIAGIQATVRDALAGVDAMLDLGDATGSAVENISALDNLARRTGTTLDAVSGVLIKFNDVLKDADPDKGAGAVLKSLNLDIEELKRLDPAEALRRVAVALSGYADDGTKARAVQELFGRSVREAGPFLKDLATQTSLVSTVTRDQAEEMDRLSKLVAAARADWVLFSRTLVADVTPAINEVLRQLNAGRGAFGGFWSAAMNVGTSRTFDTNLDALQHYQKELARVQRAQAAIQNETSSFFKGFGQQNLDAEAEKLRKFVDYYQRLLGLTNGEAGGGRGFVNATSAQQLKISDGGKPAGGGRTGASPRSEFDSYLEGLQRQIQATKDLTTVETVLDDIQGGRLGKVSAAQKEQLLAIAKQIDGANEFTDAMTANDAALQREFEDRKRIADEVAQLFTETRTPAEQLGKEITRLNDLLAKGSISWDLYARAMFMAQDRYEKAVAPIKAVGEELDTFAKQAAKNIQSQLGEGLYNVMSGNFKNIGDSFLQMLNRMVAEAAAADLSKYLLGGLVEGGKGQGVLGSLFSSFFGGFGGAKAGGGDVFGGRAYLVGEQGPEMFVPRTAGTVLTAKATADMGSSKTYNMPITVNVPGGTSRPTAEQIANTVGREVRRSLSRGGT